MTSTTNANPYRHRRQRVPDVGTEVQANIAEYAAIFVIINVDTGDLYSESPILKKEAKSTGRSWGSTCILPRFARRYKRFKDALRRSQKLSDCTGCVFAVVPLAGV